MSRATDSGGTRASIRPWSPVVSARPLGKARASRESHAGSGGPPEKEGDREVAPQVAGHGYRYEGETSNKRDQRYHLFERWLGSYPQGPIARPQDEKVQGDIEGAAQQSHVAEHSKHRALAGADQAAIADSRSARAET